jgi:hypothetical protein
VCLSIVTPVRTLDLECGSARERDLWVVGLDQLMLLADGHMQTEHVPPTHSPLPADYSESSDSECSDAH